MARQRVSPAHIHAIVSALAAPAVPTASAVGRTGRARVRWGNQMFSDLPSLLAWNHAHGGNMTAEQFTAEHPFAFLRPNYQEAQGAGGGVAGAIGGTGAGGTDLLGPPPVQPPPDFLPPPGTPPPHMLPPPIHPPLVSALSGLRRPRLSNRRPRLNVMHYPPPAP